MAETSTTTNMNLILPTPGERLGPVWATDLNTALTAIDAHDHSSGKGVQINNAGITVNADFDFRKSGTAYPIINLQHASFIKQTGHPAVNNDVYVYGSGTVGDLWFRNNNGVNVQITSGTAVYLPASGDSANIFPIRTGGPVSGTHTIAGTSSETVILVDTTSAPCTVTLPDTTAAGMNSGRFYVIKDISGNSATYNITVQRSGTSDTIDGATSVVMNSNYQAVYFHFAAALTWARI